MRSIFKLSRNDESKAGVPPARVDSPQDAGTNWENLRGLTKNAYQSHRSTQLRTALLAALLIVGLGSLGLVLHNHVPALVSFGAELSETVHRLASGSPTPAPHEPALSEVPHARSRRRPTIAPVREAQPVPTFGPEFHPFYATVVVGGRRVSLVSNNNIVVLDVAGGTWKYSSELQ
jgi:hypothetical protein